MRQIIGSFVSVVSSYNKMHRKTVPRKVFWSGREYKINHIGLHHTSRQGKTLYHIFSVASETLSFKLSLNTETLNWTLEEISDGESE